MFIIGKLLFTLIFIILVIMLLASCIKIVPQANSWIIEFLGKYHTTWEAGIHFKIPVLYRCILQHL